MLTSEHRLVNPYVQPVLYVRRPGSDHEESHRFPDDDPFFSEVSVLIDNIEDIEEDAVRYARRIPPGAHQRYRDWMRRWVTAVARPRVSTRTTVSMPPALPSRLTWAERPAPTARRRGAPPSWTRDSRRRSRRRGRRRRG